MFKRRRLLELLIAVCLAVPGLLFTEDQPDLTNEPNLTEEQKLDFLLHAKVIKHKEVGTGITHIQRLTLTDGTITHDAAFQPIDERKPVMKLSDGRTEIGFRDSYHFNIAAYKLAKLLGMENMLPVTVERSWQGNSGAVSWWIPWKWMENMRQQQHINPPDIDAWNKQMYKIRVLDQLVYDTDPNLTNVLITPDWRIWRIDFTRAFRQYKDLQNTKDLQMCDRQLLDKLRKLDSDEVNAATKPHLTKSEIKALLARRDKIVEHYDKLIAEKGEKEVLY